MANLTTQITQYLKEARAEIKKVTWPNKKEIRQHTILVIAISLAVAAFLGFCDYLLVMGFEKLILK